MSIVWVIDNWQSMAHYFGLTVRKLEVGDKLRKVGGVFLCSSQVSFLGWSQTPKTMQVLIPSLSNRESLLVVMSHVYTGGSPMNILLLICCYSYF